MTKKDYELIAKTLKGVKGIGTTEEMFGWGNTCSTLAAALKKENDLFNVITFLDACGFDLTFGREWRREYAA